MTVPLLAFVAWSGTGKTTLLKQLIPLLKAYGIRPGLIKHTHHQMDVDTPGKDSYELRKAGADQVLVASQQRWALMSETPECDAVDLHYLASRMDATTLDIVLVEGFKGEAVPKIVLWRAGAKGGVEELLDGNVIAVASNCALNVSLPLLDINQPEIIAAFISNWLKK
ncbi:molybdopterin-guanine dinucleotide biosynthesis protein MobB [Pantoea osteomyelitidis]|uniref:Molybdopterin-guanine dinucleotide biosynthesis protein MobB n=1 Tax=Pantoea osteomyelitidis TaxID=3230026 RepID=A0ABW7PQL1_9GAMM